MIWLGIRIEPVQHSFLASITIKLSLVQHMGWGCVNYKSCLETQIDSSVSCTIGQFSTAGLYVQADSAWYQDETCAALFPRLNHNQAPSLMQWGLGLCHTKAPALRPQQYDCSSHSIGPIATVRWCFQADAAWYQDESCAVLFPGLNHTQTKPDAT